MVHLKATVPEVYSDFMKTILSYSYYALEETLNYLKSIKLNSYPGENISDFCVAILVDSYFLDRSIDFNTKYLDYITIISEYTSDSIFIYGKFRSTSRLRSLLRKFCVYDEDAMQPTELISNESFVQEDMFGYHELVYSKQWDPAAIKETSQGQTFLPKSYTVEIYQSVNKDLNQVGFKILQSYNCNISGGGSYFRSDVTCHRCGNKFHAKNYSRSIRNCSSR